MVDKKDKGWVILHRTLLDNEFWISEPFTKPQAWIDLFGNANHTPKSFWVRDVEVKLERGQLGWSELTMAKRWRWSRNKVRAYLTWLEKVHQIKQAKSRLTTIITIRNYERYQGEFKKGTSEGTTERTTEGTQLNNVNKENNNTVVSAKPPRRPGMAKNAFKTVEELFESKQRHIQLVGLYIAEKGQKPRTPEQVTSIVSQSIKHTKEIAKYDDDQIAIALEEAKKFPKWTMNKVLHVLTNTNLNETES